jgi:hypothetical protein
VESEALESDCWCESHKSCGGGERAKVRQMVGTWRTVDHRSSEVDAVQKQGTVQYGRSYQP